MSESIPVAAPSALPTSDGSTALTAPDAAPTGVATSAPVSTPVTAVAEAGQPLAPLVPPPFALKSPDGQVVDAAVMSSFSELAQELSLSQESAQTRVDRMTPTIQKQQMQQVQKVVSEWTAKAQSDTEFGGPQLNENLAVAKKALDAFGTPELKTLLNQSGLGNHPDVIRFMFRAGKALSEDKFVAGTAGASRPVPKDFAGQSTVLYPKQS